MLNAAYDQTMDRISKQQSAWKDLAMQALSWITYAERPLTTSELQHALAIELGESALDKDNLPEVEDIVSVCAGLVTVDDESCIIRLVHYTTQEYLVQKTPKLFPNVQPDITEICLTYLYFDKFSSGCCHSDGEFQTRMDANKFYDYAAKNWGHHARRASTLAPMVLSFLECTENLQASIQALIVVMRGASFWSQAFPKNAKGIHLAVRFEIEQAIRELLKKGVDVNLRDDADLTPLAWAASGGHESAVKLLLAEPDIDVEARDNIGRTPFAWAAEKGHIAVVKMLLDTGKVNPDAENRRRQTPLALAAESGNETAVKLLLDTGSVDVNSGFVMTPLHWAIRSGNVSVVKLLLDTGKVDVNRSDLVQRTPLMLAYCSWAIFQLLIDTHQCDRGARDGEGRTLLSWAADGGDERIVGFLLDNGSQDSIGAKDSANRAPLSWAAYRGQEAVVKLLLETGKADVHLKDKWGNTPLSLATEEGHTGVIKLLQQAL